MQIFKGRIFLVEETARIHPLSSKLDSEIQRTREPVLIMIIITSQGWHENFGQHT